MNSLSIFTLKVLRKLYAKAFGKYQFPPLQREEDPDKASKMIYRLLANDNPCIKFILEIMNLMLLLII